MTNVESVSCEVSNGTVNIYDQNGNWINALAGYENAYSTGQCIIVETETMSYTYRVRRDGSLEQTGMRGRPSKGPTNNPLPDSAEPRRERSSCEDSHYRDYIPPSPPSEDDGSPGCWLAVIIVAILYFLVYQKGCSDSDGNADAVPSSKQTQRQQVSSLSRSNKYQPDVIYSEGNLQWKRFENGDHWVGITGKYFGGDSDFKNNGKIATLHLIKRNGHHEASVSFPDKIVSYEKKFVIYGFDSAEPEAYKDLKCLPSGSDTAVFFDGDATDFINEMRGKRSLVVSCGFRQGNYMAIFGDISRAFDKYFQLDKGLE